MYKLTLIATLLLLASCESADLSALNADQRNYELKNKEALLSCYNNMMEELPADFTGTACNVCLNDSLIAYDTITVYSAFFADNVQHFEDSYEIKWILKGEGATIIGPDSMRSVTIALNSSGSDSLQLTAFNTKKYMIENEEWETICSEIIDLAY